MADKLDPITEAALRGAADVANVDLALYEEGSWLKAEIPLGDRAIVIERCTVDNFVTSVLALLRSFTP